MYKIDKKYKSGKNNDCKRKNVPDIQPSFPVIHRVEKVVVLAFLCCFNIEN